MCTYVTRRIPVSGSGKGPHGWFPVTDATVYLDHPTHAAGDHTLNVDFLNMMQGPSARVAVELDPECARQLAVSILAILDSAPPDSPAALLGGPTTSAPMR